MRGQHQGSEERTRLGGLPSGGALALALALAAACGGPAEYAVVGSPRATATDGILQLEEAEGGERLLTLVLDRLPPPADIAEGMTTYVAWLDPTEGEPTKLGALEYDAAAERGRLMATTALPAFTLRVTAEASAEVERPSDLLVARRRVAED
ncbi:MAG TPA: hypothetical protein RMH85_33550 [Polyangiaceae bacterium LLY-WYZ-15_(1-7)]|nr:hypothetical protein [Sandaracinus sp.]MBJ72656.1 hypothetical protein [Sandaracinus sp.]HJL06736.1 hypothetical protein [Polyangiaceae bacterium LLY-WYZ-15_(1-7)]HJL13457.1 hypothetical protein [Polyangiaceae bacterium LLY-WYZ-15_(1-7)]HJL49124.1 hypothetical protein [Polyangiaceae bacterium LLY-WYZ-15_(1-7)]